MKVTDEFFEKSDLNGRNFFPDDDLTRFVISGFLARNYVSLEPSDFLDHPDIDDSKDVSDINKSFQKLLSEEYIKKVEDGYRLNRENPKLRELEDERINAIIDERW
jgi:hypothetical protein